MSRNAAVAIYLAALALTAAILALFGRNPWCSVGDLWPWSWETGSAHNSQHLLDPYSFTHVEHGILFFAGLHLLAPRASLRTRLMVALTLAAGWEILENSAGSLVVEPRRHAPLRDSPRADHPRQPLAQRAHAHPPVGRHPGLAERPLSYSSAAAGGSPAGARAPVISSRWPKPRQAWRRPTK